VRCPEPKVQANGNGLPEAGSFAGDANAQVLRGVRDEKRPPGGGLWVDGLRVRKREIGGVGEACGTSVVSRVDCFVT
jgi:hypothetical protein